MSSDPTSLSIQADLCVLTRLSREVGTGAYVKGGGGNTSCKNSERLWVKPSGASLSSVTETSWAEIERDSLRELYDRSAPDDPSEREARAKDVLERATLTPGKRASVETPLHDSMDGRFVVHVHPALLNGLLCSRESRKTAEVLFPDALWCAYTDPGFTLCIATRKLLIEYRAKHGYTPRILLMDRHGIFVAGDSEDELKGSLGHLMQTMADEYVRRGISDAIAFRPPADPDDVAAEQDLIQDCLGEEGREVVYSPSFRLASGPVSPDHIVYARSRPLITACPSRNAFAVFREHYGYLPRIVATSCGVYACAPDRTRAELAMELTRDGALVAQLAEAFGGIFYLNDAQARFIDTWEVEAYRRQVTE